MDQVTTVAQIVRQYRNGERFFEGLDIVGNFIGTDLSGIEFEACFLECDFIKCNLSNAKFNNGNIKTCAFRNSNLTAATFTNLAVEDCEFKTSNVEGIIFNKNYCFGQHVNQVDFHNLFME